MGLLRVGKSRAGLQRVGLRRVGRLRLGLRRVGVSVSTMLTVAIAELPDVTLVSLQRLL